MSVAHSSSAVCDSPLTIRIAPFTLGVMVATPVQDPPTLPPKEESPPSLPRYSHYANGQRQVSRYSDPYEVWRTIERILELLGISQRRLGVFLGMPIPDNGVYVWKSGRQGPSPLYLHRMLELVLDFHEGRLDVKTFKQEDKWSGKTRRTG